MAALEDRELEDWCADLLTVKEHVRKLTRTCLAIEEILLRLTVQMKDAAAPNLLDSLSDSPKE